jgi:hypothetical protein
MTNVILISATMVASSLGTMTNDISTGGVCMVEARLQLAESYRAGPFVGAAVDMTIAAVRELHKEVEELRAEVKRLRNEAAKPPAVQPQFYPYPQPFAPAPQYTFPTGFYFNVGIVTNDCGKVTP